MLFFFDIEVTESYWVSLNKYMWCLWRLRWEDAFPPVLAHIHGQQDKLQKDIKQIIHHARAILRLELLPATFAAVGCLERFFSGRPVNSHIVKIKQTCHFRT